MKWKIVADSGADIRHLDSFSDNIAYEVVPLILNIGTETFYDTPDLDIPHFLSQMENASQASTSACPSPETYAEAYRGSDNIICFTLSAGVSGSYNSASLAKEIILEENPSAHIHIFDTHSAGSEMDILILKAAELIEEGLEFDVLIEKLETFHQDTNVNFLLQSVDNLAKNGRLPKFVAQMIGFLGIRLIGKRSEQGTIELAQKSKGNKRAMNALLEEMKKNGYQGGKVIISHVLNEELSLDFEEILKTAFPNSEIMIIPCSGLCSFYAERSGLIIGYYCK